MDNNTTLVTGAKKITHDSDEKNNIDVCIQSFSNQVLANFNSLPKVKEELIHLSSQGKLTGHFIRPTAWKIFLNVLPSNETDSLAVWINTVKDQRKLYKKRIKALSCLKKLSGDPLGKEKETGWNSFFEDSDIKKLINLDVSRTFQDKQLFNTSFIKDLLCNILFLWAKENKNPCYKQGMNEILAILVFAFYPFYFSNPYEKEPKANTIQTYLEDPKAHEKELYYFFHDEAELQSDLYFVFTNIMKQGASKFFENFKLEQVKDSENQETYLSQRCGVLIHEKLQLYDKPLYDHFIKIDLDCQIFLQRWLKCIFNREFHPRDVEYLWDGILSSEKKEAKSGLEMIDYISVAMIVFIKKELTGKDQNDCFQRLFRYPPIESTFTLVQLATKIKSSNEEKIKAGVKVQRKKRPSEEPKISSQKKSAMFKKESNGNENRNNNSNNNSNSNSNANSIISNSPLNPSGESRPEKGLQFSGPMLNSNITSYGNKELLDQIESIFKKYKYAMEIPDVGNYELAMETLRKKLFINH